MYKCVFEDNTTYTKQREAIQEAGQHVSSTFHAWYHQPSLYIDDEIACRLIKVTSCQLLKDKTILNSNRTMD